MARNFLRKFISYNTNSVYPSDPETAKSQEEELYVSVFETDPELRFSKTEMEEQFNIVDRNGDGFIDASEIKVVMRNLGISYTDDEITNIMEQADVNGSGKVEKEDFIKIVSEYVQSTDPEEKFTVRTLFDFFDKDKDGFITQSELQFAIREILRDTVSEQELDHMMRLACKTAKKDTKATISFSDFKDLLKDVGFTISA